MKTSTRRKPTEKFSPRPKFVEDHIQKIRKDTFQDEPPANVNVNAPLALIQIEGSGELKGIAWMLSHPIYAAAPKTDAALRRLLSAVSEWRETGKPDLKELTIACAQAEGALGLEEVR